MNIIEIIRIVHGELPAVDAVEAIIEVAANREQEELPYEQLRCASKFPTHNLKGMLESAANILMSAEIVERFRMVTAMLDYASANSPRVEFWTGEELTNLLLPLIPNANSVRFSFPGSFRPCMTYAFRSSQGGASTSIEFAGCVGVEHLFYDVMSVLQIRNCWAYETMPWMHEPDDQAEIEVMLPFFGVTFGAERGGIDRVVQALDMRKGGRLTYETASFGHLLSSPASRAILILSEGELSRMVGNEATARQALVNSGRVYAVGAIPPGLAYEATNLRLALVVMGAEKDRTNSIRFVDLGHRDLSRPLSRGRFALRDEANLVDVLLGDGPTDPTLACETEISEVASNNYALTPARYLNSGPKDRIDAFLRKHEAVALQDLVEMIRPVNLQRSVEPSYRILEAAPSDLGPTGYLKKPSRVLEVDRPTFLRAVTQQVRPGDVLIAIKGAVGAVGIVPEHIPLEGEDEIWTAGQSIMILRARKRASIDPVALYEYLSDETVQAYLKSIAGGSGIPNIGMKDLKAFLVPVPDAQTTEKVRAAFGERLRQFAEIAQLKREIDASRKITWPHDQLGQISELTLDDGVD